MTVSPCQKLRMRMWIVSRKKIQKVGGTGKKGNYSYD
jgi:hypothetical protein